MNVRHLRVHILFLQMLLIQSEAFMHTMVLLHFGHMTPPQSISVSSWFLTLSLHVSAAEMRKVVMFQIYKCQTLTNASIILAAATTTVQSVHAIPSITTFRTFPTTTIHICFILIFDVIIACFSGLNQKICND